MEKVNNQTTNDVLCTPKTYLAFYICLSIVIILGNVLVVYVCTRKKLFEHPTWRIQLSLSFVDILTGVIGLNWSIVAIFCPFNSLPMTVTGCVVWLMTFMSLHQLLLLASERYIAVTYPLHHAQYMPNARVDKLLVVSWVTALFIGTCLTIVFYVDQFILYTLQFLYIIAMVTVMCVLHYKVFKVAKTQQTKITVNVPIINRKVIRPKNETRATKTSVIICAVFIVCLLPTILFNSLSIILTALNRPMQNESFQTFGYVLNFCLYANSAINPFIYCMRNREFRRQLKDICRI
ncbi:adenosine receptor A2a-like [Antedon mediterranea]|uniref:adenosine receptor A2a-like n=1 Tax=Antedon mediterranea TaxID=105859 RepID=UPI003AF49B07